MGLLDEIHAAIEESQEELYPYMPWSTGGREGTKKFLEETVREQAEGSRLTLAVSIKGENRLLGLMGVFRLGGSSPFGEVGYWTRTSATGQGYTTDGLKALLAFCRTKLKLARVNATVDVTNTGSQRVLEKGGLVEEGMKAKSAICHGRWQDFKLYGKVFEENLAFRLDEAKG